MRDDSRRCCRLRGTLYWKQGIVMGRSKKKQLERLASELLALTPEERAGVLLEVARRTWKPIPKDWEPPTLSGGGEWTGGSLRREDIYGDDGR
jgi:hypothetical protein